MGRTNVLQRGEGVSPIFRIWFDRHGPVGGRKMGQTPGRERLRWRLAESKAVVFLPLSFPGVRRLL